MTRILEIQQSQKERPLSSEQKRKETTKKKLGEAICKASLSGLKRAREVRSEVQAITSQSQTDTNIPRKRKKASRWDERIRQELEELEEIEMNIKTLKAKIDENNT